MLLMLNEGHSRRQRLETLCTHTCNFTLFISTITFNVADRDLQIKQLKIQLQGHVMEYKELRQAARLKDKQVGFLITLHSPRKAVINDERPLRR